jgi:hypothetical protein
MQKNKASNHEAPSTRSTRHPTPHQRALQPNPHAARCARKAAAKGQQHSTCPATHNTASRASDPFDARPRGWTPSLAVDPHDDIACMGPRPERPLCTPPLGQRLALQAHPKPATPVHTLHPFCRRLGSARWPTGAAWATQRPPTILALTPCYIDRVLLTDERCGTSITAPKVEQRQQGT